MTQLPTETVKAITETACDAYQKQIDKAKKSERDRRLHNTRLLLEKYRELKQFTDGAVTDAREVESLVEITTIMGMSRSSTSLVTESIREATIKTAALMAHVDKMLGYYSKNAVDHRRYEVIKALYLDEKRTGIEDIADRLHVDASTVYRYHRAAIADLSVLFFGVLIE